MTVRKSGASVETMSCGSSRGGIPSFASATSKACRAERRSGFSATRGPSDTMLPGKLLPAWTKTRVTHQLVILINISPGQRAEVSRVKQE